MQHLVDPKDVPFVIWREHLLCVLVLFVCMSTTQGTFKLRILKCPHWRNGSEKESLKVSDLAVLALEVSKRLIWIFWTQKAKNKTLSFLSERCSKTETHNQNSLLYPKIQNTNKNRSWLSKNRAECALLRPSTFWPETKWQGWTELW